jgi:hypothetical protein
MGMIEFVATGLTLVGVVLNVMRRREGFAVWFVANVLWVYVQSTAGIWGMVACQRRRMTWEESDDLRGRAFFDYVSMR